MVMVMALELELDATTALYFGLGLETPFRPLCEQQHRPCSSGDQANSRKHSKRDVNCSRIATNCDKFPCFVKAKTSNPFASDLKIFTSVSKKIFILYKICTKNVDSVNSYNYNTKLKLGLLTNNPIAPSAASSQFYLYADPGIIGVTLENIGQLSLTKENLANVHEFHRKIFSELLEVNDDKILFDPNKQKGIAVVPVKDGNLDWTLLEVQKRTSENYVKMLENNYKDIVVVPTHRNMGCFYVRRIRCDLSPKSAMRGTETFEDYYATKYKCQIVDRNQPLLSVSNARKIRNMLIPPEMGAKKCANDSTILIPELTESHPFPEAIWRESILLPFILHRLNFLCNLSDFADRVQILPIWLNSENYFGCQVVNDPFEDIISDDLQNEWLPSVGCLMSPFTLGAAGEFFSLEREEFLGDSFLKYATTVHLFFRNSKSDEGTLTALRSHIVGNDNLCRVAERNGIDSLLNGEVFDPTKFFLPPLYVPNERKDVTISKKSLADIIEAIIGAVLLNCGQLKAMEFINNVGIDLRVKVASDNNKVKLWGALFNFNEDEKYYYHKCHIDRFRDALLNEINMIVFTSGEEHLHRVEDCLGYKFQRKDFLRLAMTLAQLKTESVKQSNERLEFLGDGVIDYLVTLYLYLKFPEMTPGEMTDLRSSIVNNRSFAEVAVNSGLSGFLSLRDDYVQDKIALFKESLVNDELKGLSGLSRDFVESDLYNEDTCPSFTISEPPKILGDVFESILGAVYLDCGLNLSVVWGVLRSVYQNMDDIIEKRPKQPVKDLFEMFPERVTFHLPKIMGGKTIVIVEVKPKAKDEENQPRLFRGIGDNRKEAKDAAAKCAVSVIALLGDQVTL